MTAIYSTKTLFQLDKMNNRKLQKSQQFIPEPSNSILAKSFFEPRMTRINTDGQRSCRAVLGQAKLAPCFQIPSQASLHGIVKPHRSFCYANGPAFYASCRKLLEKIAGLRLFAKRGDVVKKHPQARLRVFFAKQIQHSRSESNPCFLSSYLTRSFPLISPCGPTSGCSTAHLPRCLVVYIRAIRG